MKTLEQLKEMIERFKAEHKNDKYADEVFKYNFAAYCGASNSLTLCKDYSEAKNYATSGGNGCVLVINTEKIYNYKAYTNQNIRNQVIADNMKKRDIYGL